MSDNGRLNVVMLKVNSWKPQKFSTLATQHLARRKPEARSRVGNGKVLLPMTDGRSLTARRFQDLYEDVANDLGGLDFDRKAKSS